MSSLVGKAATTRGVLLRMREQLEFVKRGRELLEMKRNRKNAWCCGAGGGVKSQFPELSIDISKERMREAIETGAQALLTSCPFCVGNLQDALSQMPSEDQDKIMVVDIIDFMASRI